jgi:polar amino acid transport system substrate-binding protein
LLGNFFRVPLRVSAGGRAVVLAWLGACCLLASPTQAQGPDIVVYTESYPPYSYLTKDGRLDGLSTRLVRRLLDETGIEYRIIHVPWTRAYRATLEEDNALIYTIARQEGREDLFQWLVQLGSIKFHLFARQGDHRFDAEIDWNMAHYRVACLVDDISCLLVKGLKVPEKNIYRIAEVNRPDVMLVLAGRADLYVAEEIHNRYRLKAFGVSPDRLKPVKTLEAGGDLFLASGLGLKPDLRAAIMGARDRLREAGDPLTLDPSELDNLPE